MVKDLLDQTFSEALTSELALVDFWAPWCGPCKAMAPALDEASAELGNKVSVFKVNIDEAPTIAGHYQVMSIPTLILFKKGQIVDRKVGGMSKTALVQWALDTLDKK
jgi:thioredoxin 1